VTAVQRAARILLQSSGQKFQRPTVLLLKELSVAVKGEREDVCQALIRELRAREDFQE